MGKSNNILTIFFITANFFLSFDKTQVEDYSGVYLYQSKYYFEKLTLKGNGEFSYNQRDEMTNDTIIGNWQVREGQIVLDSRPQRDKLLVYEDNFRKQHFSTIKICNKLHQPIHYSLFIITQKDDTLKYVNQWQSSQIKFKFKAFYLINSRGLKSPSYFIQGSNTNFFKVEFETRRIFENEFWKIDDNKIIPRNGKGEFQKYFLIKKGKK